jgi:hypothetical protein
MLAPAGTAAVLSTAPTPVMTEQPMSAASSSGTSRRIGIAEDSWTTAWEPYVPTWPYWWTGAPRSDSRVVPSSRTPWPGRRRAQRFGRPTTQ